MLHTGLWLLAVLLLVAVLAITALVGLLTSDSGSRWLLQQVPGLQVDDYRGELLGHWQAGELRWQSGGLQAGLTAVDAELDLRCLWRGALCLHTLNVQALALQLPDTETNGDEPGADVVLPDIRLPLSVEIGSVALGRLYLNNDLLVQDLQLSARAGADQLQLESLSLSHQDYHARAQGRVQLAGDWPLALTVDVGGELPQLGRQQLKLELAGTLQQELQLQARLQGALQGRLQAQASPLLAGLPASLELQLERLQLEPLLPQGLTVGTVQLTTTGSLAAGFDWQLDSRLAAQQQDLSLTANGQAGVASAVVEQLQLAAAGEGRLELTARADWHDELKASALIGLERFPWQLFAGLEQAPVAIHNGSVRLSYAGTDWQADLAAVLEGPAGEFELNAGLQGDAGQTRIEPLQVSAGSGRLQGWAQAGWQDAFSWQTELDLDQLDPSYWIADLPGLLAGTLRSSGRLDQQPSLEADLQLQGRLRGQALQASLIARGQDQTWQLPQLDLQLGDNRIHGQLQLDQQLSGQLDMTLSALGQLLPEASGALQGKMNLGGSLQQADIDLQLSGSRLAFAGQRVRQLQLGGQLRQGRTGTLELLARGVASGEESLGQLQLKAGGELAAHQLQASLKGPLLKGELTLAGSLQPDRLHWLGQLQQLSLAAGDQRMQLEQPLTIDYLHQQYARLGGHCLASGEGRLCAEGIQHLLPQLQLDYRLTGLALATLQPWLPEGLALEGQLDGAFRLQQQAAGVQGDVQLDAGRGAVRVTGNGQRFAWQEMRLSSKLLPQRVDAEIRVRGVEQGELLVQAQLDPGPADKPLTGSFLLHNVQLAVLQPFLEELEQLSGQINGEGRLAGTLLQPRLDGAIRLVDGELGGGLLPVSLEQLQLEVQIEGQQARLDGSWRSGEQGQARLQGELDWAQALQAQARLKGQELPVFVPPYADVLVAPDLLISYDPAGLTVTGAVTVPSGTIEVPELPPDSISVSEDARVVGLEPAGPGMPVHMAVTVDVGSERLTFSGFGLAAEVAGHLQVADNLAGSGILELKKGQFRGYGQKLDLRRARLLFAGPLTQPYIDIEAVRVTGNVTAGLRIAGLAEQPQTQIFSEPAMAQEQALSWLLTGKPLGGSNDGNVMAEAAVAMGLMGVLPITRKLADSLGIRDFELDSEGSGEQTSVVASGQITERLSLRYGVSVFEPGTTLGVRYQLTRRLYLDAASGLANSLDLFYRRNF